MLFFTKFKYYHYKTRNIMKKYLITALLLLTACGPQIGVLGSTHTHQDLLIMINGEKYSLSKPQFMVKAKEVHVESMDGDAIHVHATGVTLGHFFKTLGMKLDDECFKTREVKYCSQENKKVSVYVNGELLPGAQDYVMQDLDKILVVYGAEDDAQVAEYLPLVTDKAKIESGVGKTMKLG